jgi:hypothetical protein
MEKQEEAAPSDAESGYPLRLFREMAKTGGGLFAAVGGWFFFLSLCILAAGRDDASRAVEVLRFSGVLLTIAWLLLRFSAGLFPFGKRLFS